MADNNKKNTTIDMEQLKAELKKELLAEMEQEVPKPTKASGKMSKKDRDWLNEYVEIELFRDGRDYKDDVSVSVNGENCVIKRGQRVKIKRKFALALEQSQRQDLKAAEHADRLHNEYANTAAKIFGMCIHTAVPLSFAATRRGRRMRHL